MGDLTIGWDDVLRHLHPDTFVGAVVYLLFFVLLASLASRLLRITVRSALLRKAHLDRTTMTFLQQVGVVAIWVVMLILYAHLIPVLRSLGTALLAGASIA
jgi:small conductance mechanosensitive channel